jgi:hypothetical protein
MRSIFARATRRSSERFCRSESESGTSRHFVALHNSVAIEDIANIDQAAPSSSCEYAARFETTLSLPSGRASRGPVGASAP